MNYQRCCCADNCRGIVRGECVAERDVHVTGGVWGHCGSIRAGGICLTLIFSRYLYNIIRARHRIQNVQHKNNVRKLENQRQCIKPENTENERPTGLIAGLFVSPITWWFTKW